MRVRTVRGAVCQAPSPSYVHTESEVGQVTVLISTNETWRQYRCSPRLHGGRTSSSTYVKSTPVTLCLDTVLIYSLSGV